MSNKEILTAESALKGFIYTGDNLKTFAEWKKAGYTVIKGQKAFISTNLWKQVIKTDKDGNEYKKMIMVKAHLFTADQVKAI